MPGKMKNDAARFWARVAGKDHPDACWEWTGARKVLGYGKLSWEAKVTTAHRVAYALAHGPIPNGMFVCHRCDHPPCCNPAHLFLGTPKDNIQDAKAKGRLRGGPGEGALCGEQHYASKLTDAQRAEIANSCDPQDMIAARLGISVSTVSRIMSQRGQRRREPGKPLLNVKRPSRLTDAERAEIQTSALPQADLAARYGVSQSYISALQRHAGHRRGRGGHRVGAAPRANTD